MKLCKLDAGAQPLVAYRYLICIESHPDQFGENLENKQASAWWNKSERIASNRKTEALNSHIRFPSLVISVWDDKVSLTSQPPFRSPNEWS
jgi:hypothetical protein